MTAGGTDICIWHVLGSGKLVQRITAHQKTATSVMVMDTSGGAEPQVVSAGLDGHIKVCPPPTHTHTGLHAKGGLPTIVFTGGCHGG